jgi:hypothetical protein
VDIDMRHPEFFGRLEQRVQVGIVRMDATIRYL